MTFDRELFNALKKGLKALSESDRTVVRLIWSHPNVPVFELPKKDGRKASGWVWLTIGDRIARRKLWTKMPARVRRANQSPGYRPFYSGLLVKLSFVRSPERQTLAVFELRDEAVRALQELKVIGVKRRASASEYTRLDLIDDEYVPTGLSQPAERAKINRLIIERRGQLRFRQELISAYEGRCAVTRCSERNVLEAAHILGFRSRGRYEARNGLLLRADWHTLFDLGLWAINPKSLKIKLSRSVTDREYSRFEGATVKIPTDTNLAPSLDALSRRYSRFLIHEKRRSGS